MFTHILKMEDLIFYILAAEVLFLILLQFRTNGLLKKTLKIRNQKKEHIKQLKEEVKKGESDIPVVKFEKAKTRLEPVKKTERTGGMDTKEMAVLQEMITEFFG